MVTLKEAQKEALVKMGLPEDYQLSFSLIDDLYATLAVLGHKELILDKEEMIIITRYFVANARETKEGVKAMREGKIDKFLGIKLVCKT